MSRKPVMQQIEDDIAMQEELERHMARYAKLRELNLWLTKHDQHGNFQEREASVEEQHEYQGYHKHGGAGPLIGMPCTYQIGSDKYAGRVVEVSKSGHKVTVQLGTRPETNVFTRRKDGYYFARGSNHGLLIFMVSEDYRDPSF